MSKIIDTVEFQEMASRHRWGDVQEFFPDSDDLPARPVGSELALDLNFERPWYSVGNRCEDQNALN